MPQLKRWFPKAIIKVLLSAQSFASKLQTLLTRRTCPDLPASCPHSKLIRNPSFFFSHFSPFGWPVVSKKSRFQRNTLRNAVYRLSSWSSKTFNIMTLGTHIRHTPTTPISKLAPYSALILSIVLVILFLIRFYILQRFLLEKLHGSTYTQMDDITRRSFLNNYIAGVTKIVIFIIAFYPFVSVAFGTATFPTPYAQGSSVTMGDLLLIAAQMLTGMFIFELIYRVKISPVSVAHHIGSILIAQAAIAISVKGDQESSIEFLLCTVWGNYIFFFMMYYRFHSSRDFTQ